MVSDLLPSGGEASARKTAVQITPTAVASGEFGRSGTCAHAKASAIRRAPVPAIQW